MIEKRVGGLWQQLPAKKLHLPHFLSEVRLTGIRGTSDLQPLVGGIESTLLRWRAG